MKIPALIFDRIVPPGRTGVSGKRLHPPATWEETSSTIEVGDFDLIRMTRRSFIRSSRDCESLVTPLR